MKINKSASLDTLPGEVLNNEEDSFWKYMCNVIKEVWKQEKLSKEELFGGDYFLT